MNLVVAVPTFLAALSWLGFIVWYWTRATWWKGPIGRNMMGVSTVIFLAMLRFSWVHIAGALSQPVVVEWNSRSITGCLSYAALAYLGFRRTQLMEFAQRQEKNV